MNSIPSSRLPTPLLEMGFNPRQIRTAMQVLGLSGELTVAAVSQLSLWLSENPSTDSEDNIIPDRSMRGYHSGSGSNNSNTSQSLVSNNLT